MSSEIKATNYKAKDGTAGISIADSTGRVTFSDSHSLIAGTGAFLARHSVSAWSVISDQSIVPFNNASAGDSFDTDSNYNTTTYKYEVPATGVYQFYYGIYTANSDTENMFGFTTNNGEVDNQNEGANFGTIHNSEDGDHIQFCLHILPLTSGDTVWISARADSDYYSGHSYWGGCRLK